MSLINYFTRYGQDIKKPEQFSQKPRNSNSGLYQHHRLEYGSYKNLETEEAVQKVLPDKNCDFW